jgi:hypothetical protein
VFLAVSLKVHHRIHKNLKFEGIVTFVNMVFFYGQGLLTSTHIASWMTTTCRLSAAAYSTYSQPQSIPGGRLRAQPKNLSRRVDNEPIYRAFRLLYLLEYLILETIQFLYIERRQNGALRNSTHYLRPVHFRVSRQLPFRTVTFRLLRETAQHVTVFP